MHYTGQGNCVYTAEYERVFFVFLFFSSINMIFRTDRGLSLFLVILFFGRPYMWLSAGLGWVLTQETIIYTLFTLLENRPYYTNATTSKIVELRPPVSTLHLVQQYIVQRKITASTFHYLQCYRLFRVRLRYSTKEQKGSRRTIRSRWRKWTRVQSSTHSSGLSDKTGG